MRIVLILLLSSLLSVAQNQEAKLYFKDGTEVLGYGSLSLSGKLFNISDEPKILFRISLDKKADEWDYEMVDKIVFFFFEDAKTFKYMQIADRSNKITNLLLEEITEGTVSLYKTIDETVIRRNMWVFAKPNVKVNNGKINLTSNFPEHPATVMYKKSKKHYLYRQGEKFASVLRLFKKDISDYFKDCPGIKTKLDNGDINIGDLQYIVEYYNDYCFGYEFEAKDYETDTNEKEDND